MSWALWWLWVVTVLGPALPTPGALVPVAAPALAPVLAPVLAPLLRWCLT